MRIEGFRPAQTYVSTYSAPNIQWARAAANVSFGLHHLLEQLASRQLLGRRWADLLGSQPAPTPAPLSRRSPESQPRVSPSSDSAPDAPVRRAPGQYRGRNIQPVKEVAAAPAEPVGGKESATAESQAAAPEPAVEQEAVVAQEPSPVEMVTGPEESVATDSPAPAFDPNDPASVGTPLEEVPPALRGEVEISLPPDPEFVTIQDPQTGEVLERVPFQELVLDVEDTPAAESVGPKAPSPQIAPPPGKIIGEAGPDSPPPAPAPVAVDGVVSLPGSEPSQTFPRGIPQSVADYRQYEDFLRDVKGRMDGYFAENYEPAFVDPRARGRLEHNRADTLQSFVDPESGLSYAEINTMEQRLQGEWKQGLLSRERPPSANYGPNAQDRELLADPRLAGVQSRYQAFLDTTPEVTQIYESESIRETLRRPADEAERRAFGVNFVDSETGLSGADLQRLERVTREKEQYDRAMNELEFYNLGSFTDNDKVSGIKASRVFTAVGHDQRLELIKDGTQELGKAHVLADGRLLLQDEHETGVWFVSDLKAAELSALGIIDTANGGLNIDGLYLHGSAHIGTSRADGGVFGKLVNTLGHVLPGGKLGELTGDAISNVNQLLNQPGKEFLAALGQDEEDFAMQVVLHQEASVDVLAHASETEGKTFDALVQRTAEYGAVDRAANAVGKVLVASNIPIVNLIGAGIVVASGAVMAGQAQMAGDRDADPNQGIKDAVTTYFTSHLTTGAGNLAGESVAAYGAEMSTFASSFASNLTSQAASGEGDIDLASAFEAGLLGAVGVQTSIPGTTLNAVQLAEFGESVRRAEETGDWSGVAASLAEHITAPYRPQEPTLLERLFTPQTQTEPAAGASSDSGSAGSATSAPPQVQDNDANVGSAPAPSGSGEGEPAPAEEATIPMTPDALDRQQFSRESTATVGPDGSTTIVRPDGTRQIVLPSGVVMEAAPDSRVVSIRTSSQDRAGFEQAFGAARAEGMEVFSWNGQLYNTELAPAQSAPIQPTPQQLEQLVRLGPGATPQEIERFGVTPADPTPRPLAPKEVRTLSDYADYLAWVQQKYPEFSHADITQALRQEHFSGRGQGGVVDDLFGRLGGRRNSFPVVYEELNRGPGVADRLVGAAASFLAGEEVPSLSEILVPPAPPVGSRQRQLVADLSDLPSVVTDSKGDRVNVAHALVALDGLRADMDAGNLVPEPGRVATALTLTHAGDLAQAGLAYVYYSALAVGAGLDGLHNVAMATATGGDVAGTAATALRDYLQARARVIPNTLGAASADQLRGNQRGLEVALTAAPFTPTSDLLRQLDGVQP